MTRARKLLTTALAAAVVLAGVSLASAASLPLGGGVLTSANLTHPCAGGTLAATTPPTSIPVSTVEITPSAACVGRTVAVTVVAGAVQRQGTAKAPASGSVTVTLDGSYSPPTTTQVAAVVDGWNLPTTWAYTPPAVGLTATCFTEQTNATCAADVVLRNSWAGGYNLDITVRDTRTFGNSHPYAWTVVINFSSAGYPFVPKAIDSSEVVTASTCGSTLNFTGVTNLGTYHQLDTRDTRTFSIQPKSSGTGSVLTCP